MPAWVVYRMLGLNGADRLAFASCETHCETFVKKWIFFNLYRPRCIIGVCSADFAEAIGGAAPIKRGER